ncbi:hypothetical protein LPJ66_006312, partial [Kickxella alabastrina]
SMSTHDSKGTTVCVHSVCVAPQQRRQGIASRILAAYTESIKQYNAREGAKAIERLAMLSREDLVPMYKRAGYTCLGQSGIVH